MISAEIARRTRETDITLRLLPENPDEVAIWTGCGFLDHMLAAFALNSRVGLTVQCAGDTQVDDHHTVEDIGIALGRAYAEALGNKAGIARYGSFILPMDETLVLAAIDISGRCSLNFDVAIPAQKVGSFDTELTREFFFGFARALGCSLHLKLLAGINSHHIIEAVFKAFGRALSQAAAADPGAGGRVPSSKGVL
jgi:imidazoleglycerol-phosphate dehydratase